MKDWVISEEQSGAIFQSLDWIPVYIDYTMSYLRISFPAERGLLSGGHRCFLLALMEMLKSYYVDLQ